MLSLHWCLDGLTSPLARQSTMHVSKKSKELFYGVKSSSSSPGASGINADFTADRNEHFFKNLTDPQVT